VPGPPRCRPEDLLPKLETYGDLERLALIDWVALLKERVDSGKEIVLPAMKLVDLIERACKIDPKRPIIDYSKSLALGSTLRSTRHISANLMKRWISQWRSSR
jgi:hypothetical protein